MHSEPQQFIRNRDVTGVPLVYERGIGSKSGSADRTLARIIRALQRSQAHGLPHRNFYSDWQRA